ncbi:FAD-dependent monooxygenase [Nocardia nova]|uniref:FAD-dependent monooxygenase n=1 Tax=Nocardia nova TaxID=37330 RepID=UPI00130D6D0A|nr:FAD-dependent monooxygenase [Nocardia nova]
MLISGASIAGPAVADMLMRQGFEVTVVERARDFRSGGQNVDVDGTGRLVADRMGLTDQIRAAGTGETGTEFVDAAGKTLALFPASDASSFTTELEVPRGALAQMLYDRTAGQVRYLFGEQIIGVNDHADGVTVRFSNGREEAFDLVIVAEGLRSHTRKLLFDDAELHHLGLYMAWFPIPRQSIDNADLRIYHATGGRIISLRPASGSMSALLALRSNPVGYEKLTPVDQVALLRLRFADAGWQAERILDALDPDALEFQPVAQVRARTWSTNRVVLLGDAAYAPSPLSGEGTSLALTGAYLLAGELGQSDDLTVAFKRYEHQMRPRVKQAQKLPPGAARLALPNSALGVAALRGLSRLIASPPVRAARNKLHRDKPGTDSTLPSYTERVRAE